MSDGEWQALWLSLKVSLLAVSGAFPIALATAWLLSRRRFRGKIFVDALVHLPLVLPPVVMGYLLLITFGQRAPLGAWLHDVFGFSLMFRWTGAALAAGIVTLPFQVRAMRLAFDAINPQLEAAARSLGAGPLDTFMRITLPLALPGVIAGAITAFAASLGEFGAIITFVSNVPGETRTLPLAIYTALQTPGGEAAAARLSALAIALAVAGLIGAELAAHRIRRWTR